MGRKKFFLVGLSLLTGTAFAQSSVTLYGLLDAGLTYTNDVVKNGVQGSSVELMTGVAQGSRWGMRGTEDIGGGNKIIFQLESGFQLDTGVLSAGGRLFGYGSYVGAQGGWGTLTMGRQYDFIGWYFPAYAVASNTPAGLLAWSLPSYSAGGYSLDNRVWGDWVDNSVKYVSPNFGGFDFGAMYGFGEVAGSLGKSATTSVIANYNNGPFGASVSYYTQKNAVDSDTKRIIIGGAAYSFKSVRLFGLVSDVRISSAVRPRATTYELGAVYTVTQPLSIGLGYQYQSRNNDVGDAQQLTLSLDYQLSKRTDVYLVGAYGRDRGFGSQVVAAIGGPSSGSSQTAVRVGMRHRF
ncbi:porin [Cupriavidus sp. PET2-C1]